jgi:glycosyltransferase involved in cell wall biosynthesis
MKIATVANLSARKLGGFERELMLLSRELAARGHTHIIYLTEAPPDWFCELLGGTATVRTFSPTGAKPMLQLAQSLSREHVDLVHLHFFRVFGFTGPAMKWAGVSKVVISEHMGLTVINRPRWKRIIVKMRARAIQPTLDRIVCISDYVKNRLMVSDFAKPYNLERIYNGVDLTNLPAPAVVEQCRQQLAIGADTRIVCIVAYATAGKGLETLQEAAAQVLHNYPDTVFVHLGDGPLLAELAAQAQALGIQNKFRQLGHQLDPLPWIGAADMIVVPSIEPESLSYAVLEGMTQAKAVIGTTVGGIPEAIADGETGLLVPPGDVDKLAAAIVELLADSQLTAAFGRAGRMRAETLFDLRRKVADTIALYERVVNG